MANLPNLATTLIDTCQDFCQNTLGHFEQLIEKFEKLAVDLYNWATDTSFPNVIYQESDAQFYYVPPGLMTSLTLIPNMPNVLLKDGLLSFNTQLATGLIFGKQIVHNIYFDNTIDEFFFRRVMPDGSNQPAFPYTGCVRFFNGKLEAYTGGSWLDISFSLENGAVLYNPTLKKLYFVQGSTLHDITIPFAEGDLRENGGKMERYDGTTWAEYWPNGFARIKAGTSQMEVWLNNTWEDVV